MGTPLAYYSENDPAAAAWLRELIGAGEIALGVVDERSIADVRAEDLEGYSQCHFFAGIGGWSRALRLAGWADDRPVWTGSCPCPSFSAAGRGNGFRDPRHLWPAWFRLIRECRPVCVFGEQVAAAIGHGWLDLVSTDLEAEGYAFGAAVLGAHSVGAPHIRQRLWFVAESKSEQHDRGGDTGRRRRELADDGELADADCIVASNGGLQRSGRLVRPAKDAAAERVAHAGSESGERDSRGISGTEAQSGRSGQFDGDLCHGYSDGGPVVVVAHAEHSKRGAVGIHRSNGCDRQDGGRSQAHGESGTCGEVLGLAHSPQRGQRTDRGASGPAGHDDQRGEIEQLGHTDLAGSQGWGRVPERARERAPRSSSMADNFWSACDWLPCRDGKHRPTQPGVAPLVNGSARSLGPRRDSGLSDAEVNASPEARVMRLRGYGNAIVAPLAAEFIAACMEIQQEQEQG
jgi:DNA (cytosine-5)-methyltransferase 1